MKYHKQKISYISATILISAGFFFVGSVQTTYAATPVSSYISSDTTWVKENSPYVITGQVTVVSGITLTINPGVIVKFDRVNGWPFTQGVLIVDGTLKADATPKEPIYFTSYYDDTVGGDTNGDGTATSPDTIGFPNPLGDGIKLNNPTPPSLLNNVYIKYSSTGLLVKDGTHQISNIHLIKNTYYGLQMEGGNIDISNAEIVGITTGSGCSSFGIGLTGGNLTVTHANISNNDYGGILASGGNLVVTTSQINNNGNGCYGNSGGGVVGAGSTITLIGNTISGTHGADMDTGGVHIAAGSVNIQSNTFTNNRNAIRYSGGFFISDGKNTADSPFLLVAAYDDLYLTKEFIYLIRGEVKVSNVATLIIDPGVIVKFDRVNDWRQTEGTLIVDGILKADATPEEPIYFTSYYDDTIGGDTNGDGAATSPESVGWPYQNPRGSGIQLTNSISPSVLNNVYIKYSNVGLFIKDGVHQISNIHLIKNSSYGLKVDGGNINLTNAEIVGPNVQSCTDFGVFLTGGNLTITQSKISSNGYAGVYASSGNLAIATSQIDNNGNLCYGNSGGGVVGAGGTITLIGNTISGTHGADMDTGGVHIAAGSVNIQSNTFTNNRNAIRYSGGSFTSDGKNTVDSPFLLVAATPNDFALGKEFSYLIRGEVRVLSNSILTINPGVIVKFDRVNGYPFTQGVLIVDGMLKANGTSQEPIYFTSFYDDAVGGDTNGDGTATSPDTGGYPQPLGDGIKLTNPNSPSLLNNIYLKYNSIGLEIKDGIHKITNTHLIKNTYGLQMDGGSIEMTNAEITDNSYGGVYVSGGSATIKNSSIHRNAQGLYVSLTSTLSVNAQNNWWGDVSGPYHSLVNNGGKGDSIGGFWFTNFTPWLISDPIQQPIITKFWTEILSGKGMLDLWMWDGSSGATKTKLKQLPDGWTVFVTNTLDDSGNVVTTPIDATTNYRWYQVKDETDGTTGWMQAGIVNTSPDHKFIKEFLKIDSRDLSATSSIRHDGSDDAAYFDRAELVRKAVDHYYNNTTKTPDLYSAADKSRIDQLKNLPDFKDKPMGSFPTEVILGFLAQEDGGPFFRFYNENVSRDYGHGISQVTLTNYPSKSIWDTKSKLNGGEGDYDNRGVLSDLKVYPCKAEGILYKQCYTDPDKDIAHSYKAPENGGQIYKFYTNTIQSIYANIKDGLGVLRQRYDSYNGAYSKNTEWSGTYASKTPGVDGWGKNCPVVFGNGSTVQIDLADMRKIVAVKSYNGTPHSKFGLVFDEGGQDCYLSLVGDKALHLDRYYSYYKANLTSDEALKLAKKIQVVDQNKTTIDIHSPGVLRVIDNTGVTTGFLNDGSLTMALSNVVYDENAGKSAEVYFSDNSYLYQVVGDQSGTYSLTINNISPSGTSSVALRNIPLALGEIYTYQVDWTVLTRGEKGVTMQIDKKGDGTMVDTIKIDASLDDTQAPTTTPVISGTLGQHGWYTSNVMVALNADDGNGVGVKSTKYSLDNGALQTYASTSPISITTEGIHTLYYHSTDYFDNQEATSTLTIKIDKTPPEAKIYFDKDANVLKVEGVDNLTTNPIVMVTIQKSVDRDNKDNTKTEPQKNNRGRDSEKDHNNKSTQSNDHQDEARTIYQIQDDAGHTLKLTFKGINQEGKEIKAKLEGAQYDSQPIIKLPRTPLSYEWSLDKKTRQIKELNQQIQVKDQFKIEAQYNQEKNETKITIQTRKEETDQKQDNQENKQDKEQTLPGLVIIKLDTKSGSLSYEF